MSARQWLVTDAADVAGITGSYVLAKLITIVKTTSRDANADVLPGSGYWSHLDFECLWDAAGAAPTTATIRLFWDAGCDHPASGESTINLTLAGTTTNLYVGCVGLDVWPKRPSVEGGLVGTLYALVKQNGAGATITTKMVRLHGRDHHGG